MKKLISAFTIAKLLASPGFAKDQDTQGGMIMEHESGAKKAPRHKHTK